MSLPTFPPSASITREDATNQIISSIAMEEVALSHILNAEGEKIQYVLGTLEGAQPLPEPVTIQNLLDINQSVRETMDSALQSQMFLKNKLATILSASQNGDDPTPIVGGGFVIPFSSGDGGTITTDTSGNPESRLNISFGESSEVITEDPIIGSLSNVFIVPADIIISSISASFSLFNRINTNSCEVFAEIYQSDPSESVFTPIPGTLFSVGTILPTDPINNASIANSLTGLSVQIPANTKLTLMFKLNSTAMNSVNGQFSGGILANITEN